MEHSEDMVERRFRHTVRILQGIPDGTADIANYAMMIADVCRKTN